MYSRLKYFLPLAIVITVVFFCLYVLNQQLLRRSANNPQIQVSKDLANKLANGQNIAGLMPTQTIDLSQSSALFVIIYNASGQIFTSTASLNGKNPVLPKGVLDSAKRMDQNAITWMPAPGVREAIVVTQYNGSSSGFVLVGRSLKETEAEENILLRNITVGWMLLLLTAFLIIVFFLHPTHKRPKSHNLH